VELEKPKKREPKEVELLKPHTSFSQISSFLDCPMVYYFRWIEQLKIPPPSAMVLGTDYHKAIAYNFQQKITTGIDVPEDEVLDVFNDAWENDSKYAIFPALGKPSDVKDSGYRVLQKHYHLKQITTQPMFAEKDYRVEFPDFPYDLVGKMDLVTDKGEIVDHKLRRTRPQAWEAEDSLQLSLYGLGYRRLTDKKENKLVLEIGLRQKTPDIVEVSAPPINEERCDTLSRIIGYTMNQIEYCKERGIFLPNRRATFCSPNGCGFWYQCHKVWR